MTTTQVTFIESCKASNRATKSTDRLDCASLQDLAKESLGLDGKTINLFKADGSAYNQGDPLWNGELYVTDRAPRKDDRPLIHLCMLGPGAVGKSCLTLRYTSDTYTEEYDPTIEDAYRKTIQVDGTTVVLDILDTAGQEDFVALRNSWYRNKDAFLLIFSVDVDRSLTVLEGFWEQLCEYYDDADNVPPFILVGNKCDLEKKAVTPDQGQAKAKKWGAIRYVEASAKTGHNVNVLFSLLLRATLERRRSPAAPPDQGCCQLM